MITLETALAAVVAAPFTVLACQAQARRVQAALLLLGIAAVLVVPPVLATCTRLWWPW